MKWGISARRILGEFLAAIDKKDTYVLLNDEDFQSVKVESSSVMSIEKFVDVGSIDPLYYDTSYYLAPDGDAGRDVYAVLYKAIEEAGRVALSRVVIAQRERTIALRPMEGGLVAHTLHEQRDINDAKAVFDDATAIKTDPEMITLARQLIDRRRGPTILQILKTVTRRGFAR